MKSLLFCSVAATCFLAISLLFADPPKVSFPLVPSDPANFPEEPDREINCAVTVMLTEKDGKTFSIRLVNGSTLVRGCCFSPDGRYLYLTHQISRYQMPCSQIERGWRITNAVGIIDVGKKAYLNSVLLDDVDRGAANPWGCVVSKDGQYLYVTLAGTHELMRIDRLAMHEKLASCENGPDCGKRKQGVMYARDVPNDLRFLENLKFRIPLPSGSGPREVTLREDGSLAIRSRFEKKLFLVTEDVVSPDAGVSWRYSLDYVDDPDTVSADSARTAEEEKIFLGERYFNDATFCFQNWLSCASCHPDGRMDGLNWDLLIDGVGNPKNTRSLLGAAERTQFFSAGVIPRKGKTDTPAVEALKEAVRWAIQHQWYKEPRDEEMLDAITAYLASLKPLPGPALNKEAFLRGKKLFENLRCHDCHSGPQRTDNALHDVGTKGYYDRESEFLTPPLTELRGTAPYLHDGRYATLGELFRSGKHGIDDLTESPVDSEIDDLVEYLLGAE